MSQINSASSREIKIRSYLLNYANGKYANAVIEFDPDSGGFLIIIPNEISTLTERAISMLKRRIKEDLVLTTNIIQKSSLDDSPLMLAVNELLEKELGENFVLASAMMSHNENIWMIIYTTGLADEEKDSEKIKKSTNNLRDLFDIFEKSLEKIYFSGFLKTTPSAFQIIRQITIKQPICFEELKSSLDATEFPPPSERWLRRQLDSLVRKGFVGWERPGSYSATAAGIALLPATKNRNSIDVLRALDLGREDGKSPPRGGGALLARGCYVPTCKGLQQKVSASFLSPLLRSYAKNLPGLNGRTNFAKRL